MARHDLGKKAPSGYRLCCCEPPRYWLCQQRIAIAGLAPPGTHPANMICGYNPGEYEAFIQGGFTL